MTICFLALTHLAFTAEAQNVRCSYEYFYKKDPAKGFYKVPDMRLDHYNGKSAWYSETTFLGDSLKRIAFDETGHIADQEAYSQITRNQPKLFEATTIDFQAQSFLQHYQDALIRLNGKGELTLPEWVLSNEEKEIEGYHCHKATARYLGRDWTVWYTEEIPINIGPWLLWGAPGLIVEARDADNCFVFKFTGIDALTDGFRFDLLRDFNQKPHVTKREGNYTTDELRKIESTYTKLRSDVNFFDEAHHIKGSRLTDANGKELDRAAYFKYIPLIPAEYWKNSK
jgi:GLPGLI family protein